MTPENQNDRVTLSEVVSIGDILPGAHFAVTVDVPRAHEVRIATCKVEKIDNEIDLHVYIPRDKPFVAADFSEASEIIVSIYNQNGEEEFKLPYKVKQNAADPIDFKLDGTVANGLMLIFKFKIVK